MSQSYNPALDQTDDILSGRSGVGSFGRVVFQVSEEQLHLVKNVQRTTAARTEEHQVVGAKPRLEFLAPELDKVSFTVFWHRGFGADPRAEIKKLRELCTAGATRLLILGGENMGKFLLEEMQESWMHSGPNGAPLVAEASLTLKEYQ
jgi:phage protein U